MIMNRMDSGFSRKVSLAKKTKKNWADCVFLISLHGERLLNWYTERYRRETKRKIALHRSIVFLFDNHSKQSGNRESVHFLNVHLRSITTTMIQNE